jgi:hypothetical protein
MEDGGWRRGVGCPYQCGVSTALHRTVLCSRRAYVSYYSASFHVQRPTGGSDFDGRRKHRWNRGTKVPYGVHRMYLTYMSMYHTHIRKYMTVR